MKSLYAIILVLSILFASCDNPTDNKGTKKKPPIPAGTTLKFANDTATLTFRAPFTATHEQKLSVTEVKEDKGAITYASDNTTIAMVDDTYLVCVCFIL